MLYTFVPENVCEWKALEYELLFKGLKQVFEHMNVLFRGMLNLSTEGCIQV